VDFVKVVDFGVAKAVGPMTTSKVTTTGLRVGTPAYMSPEQWIDGEVDHRSDTYSLALMAVEMLSGSIPNIPLALVSGAQETLSAAAAAGGWPEPVRVVLARALSTRPEDRQASSAQFAAEFVGAVSQWEPATPGVREPWEERLQTPAATPALRQSRAGRVALVAGGAVIAGSLLWIAWSARDSQAPLPGDSSAVKEVATVIDTGPPKAESPGNSPGGGVTDTAPKTGSDQKPRQQPFVLPETPAVDSVAMLRGIFDLDRPDADSARRVVAVADAMLKGALGDSARIEVWYRLAEARFFLGDEREACAALDQARQLGTRTRFLSNSIALLTARRC
jgi:serine/threonine-protein kinase